LDIVKTVPTSFCPALFAHGNADAFILPRHSQKLHDAYAGDKNLIMIDGGGARRGSRPPWPAAG
jgi:hypothetical protein